MKIEESLHCQYKVYKDIIAFSNNIVSDQVKIWVISVSIITIRNRKKGKFEILRGISENAILVQLMETLGGVNHTVIIVGHWIFESNYKKVLPLTPDSLNIICSP